MNKISLVLGMWEQGYFTGDEVINWADSQIRVAENPDSDLIELSLKGPGQCFKMQPYEFPRAIEFGFVEAFSLKLIKLNMSSDASVKHFIHWAARSAMGEDTEIPEVMFCYMLDDFLDYDESGSIPYFRENVKELLPACEERVNSILKQLSA